MKNNEQSITNLNMYQQMREFPKMWGHWTIHNVLMTYSDERCYEVHDQKMATDRQCKDFGFYFMWASIPPMKLCAHCLVQCPQYSHIWLEEGRKACNLKPSRVKGYPILHGTPLTPFSNLTILLARRGNLKTGTRIILRKTLLNIALEHGMIPATNDFGRTYFPSGQIYLRECEYVDAPFDGCAFAGCVRVWLYLKFQHDLTVLGVHSTTLDRQSRK
jgi:hypothetical protein